MIELKLVAAFVLTLVLTLFAAIAFVKYLFVPALAWLCERDDFCKNRISLPLVIGITALCVLILLFG